VVEILEQIRSDPVPDKFRRGLAISSCELGNSNAARFIYRSVSEVPIVEVLGQSLSARYTAFTAHFWDGLADGVFSDERCKSCRTFTFQPIICPQCWHGADLSGSALGGGAFIGHPDSSVPRFAAETPMRSESWNPSDHHNRAQTRNCGGASRTGVRGRS